MKGLVVRWLLFALFFSLSVFAVVYGFKRPLDEYGTREPTLVRTNGNNVCQSCMGLYK